MSNLDEKFRVMVGSLYRGLQLKRGRVGDLDDALEDPNSSVSIEASELRSRVERTFKHFGYASAEAMLADLLQEGVFAEIGDHFYTTPKGIEIMRSEQERSTTSEEELKRLEIPGEALFKFFSRPKKN